MLRGMEGVVRHMRDRESADGHHPAALRHAAAHG